jgi:hypothetical protein
MQQYARPVVAGGGGPANLPHHATEDLTTPRELVLDTL